MNRERRVIHDPTEILLKARATAFKSNHPPCATNRSAPTDVAQGDDTASCRTHSCSSMKQEAYTLPRHPYITLHHSTIAGRVFAIA